MAYGCEAATLRSRGAILRRVGLNAVLDCWAKTRADGIERGFLIAVEIGRADRAVAVLSLVGPNYLPFFLPPESFAVVDPLRPVSDFVLGFDVLAVPFRPVGGLAGSVSIKVCIHVPF